MATDRSSDMASTQYKQRPPRRSVTEQRRRIRRRAQIMMNSVLVVLILIAASAVWFLSIERRYQSRIYPNVTVLGVNVGGLSLSEAKQALEDHFQTFYETPIILTFEDRSWGVTGEELGLTINFDASLQQAYRIGRTRDMVLNIQTIQSVLQQGTEIPASIVIDERKAQASVARLASVIDTPAVDPRLQTTGTSLWVMPGQNGRMLLVDETVARIREALPTLVAKQPVTVATKSLVPRITDQAIKDAQARFYQLIGQPVVLKVGTKEYMWGSEELARMIDVAQVTTEGATDRFELSFNPYLLERRIAAIADETATMHVNPRLKWNNGNIVVTDPGKPGWRVNPYEGRDLVIASVNQSNRMVTLIPRHVPVPINQANVNTLGLVAIVSEGKSDFTGSAPYRVTNIEAGLKQLDGILIAPGEEFSFNNAIGEIDAANGFVEGYAIIANRTQLEFGGGICQDSTTLFRAAFWAGLPITERWGHSFYISWYDKYGPTGMDSTIFTGGPDLKFVNDTGNWILIQAEANVKTGVASIKFYGTPTNRKVELTHFIYDRAPAPTDPVYVADEEQPAGTVKHSDRARDGLSIEIRRTITNPDGTVRPQDVFLTQFKPWPNIFVLNPQDMADGKPVIEMPPPQPNLWTPGLTPSEGVRYISPETIAPVAEAPIRVTN
ncbi:MAG: vanomycin resistance protein VanB [Chloroflexi bacterium]|nr:vanomycin resistance protein VanB [Chloroflexota bacterium]